LCCSYKTGRFYCGDALHHQYTTFQISTKLREAFLKNKLLKIGLVSLFFSSFFSSFCQGVKVTISGNRLSNCLENWYIQWWSKGASWYQVWLECNKYLQSYLQLFIKITPICCHAHKVNHAWQKLKIGTEVG